MKLKEISYIHAEAYAAGELKHGPLALIDADMPVIVVAPNNELLEKLKSNIEEVRARGGQLYVFADQDAGFVSSDNMHIIEMPHVEEVIAPIFYTVPLQLLAYHVALIKGTDVDQPRNWQNRLRLSNTQMPCFRRAFFPVMFLIKHPAHVM